MSGEDNVVVMVVVVEMLVMRSDVLLLLLLLLVQMVLVHSTDGAVDGLDTSVVVRLVTFASTTTVCLSADSDVVSVKHITYLTRGRTSATFLLL